MALRMLPPRSLLYLSLAALFIPASCGGALGSRDVAPTAQPYAYATTNNYRHESPHKSGHDARTQSLGAIQTRPTKGSKAAVFYAAPAASPPVVVVVDEEPAIITVTTIETIVRTILVDVQTVTTYIDRRGDEEERRPDNEDSRDLPADPPEAPWNPQVSTTATGATTPTTRSSTTRATTTSSTTRTTTTTAAAAVGAGVNVGGALLRESPGSEAGALNTHPVFVSNIWGVPPWNTMGVSSSTLPDAGTHTAEPAGTTHSSLRKPTSTFTYTPTFTSSSRHKSTSRSISPSASRPSGHTTRSGASSSRRSSYTPAPSVNIPAGNATTAHNYTAPRTTLSTGLLLTGGNVIGTTASAGGCGRPTGSTGVARAVAVGVVIAGWVLNSW
ncbi:hypothetical protein DRE_07271 [Drechslerella stenobrocha 248]|uniref:Uncharacterized protein n=1 Tax=Drechslerella stenobrocha 248 TaxID=1043628 RepID=W7HUV0_9PEZI|nr:hypothetical protein DRE_07271 [Drechslerella stenobrocha 248]